MYTSTNEQQTKYGFGLPDNAMTLAYVLLRIFKYVHCISTSLVLLLFQSTALKSDKTIPFLVSYRTILTKLYDIDTYMYIYCTCRAHIIF